MEAKPKRMSIFDSATLRLTVWYMVMLMLLSLLFSGVLYAVATNEFNRALGPRRQGEMRIFIDDSNVANARTRLIEESSDRLIISLVLFNLAVLVGGGGLSYLLARRTLKPIQLAHDAQLRFTSDAAHELRTPLAVMQTEIEVGLRSKKTSAAKQTAILESNLEEVARLRMLTDRLLQLASQQELPVGTVDVEAAVVEAVTRLVPMAQKRHITIENQVGPASVRGHYDSVVDIIAILLDNAIKYSPSKSHVVVKTRPSGGEIVLDVIDQGMGIPPEEQDKIFERFYRVDSSRSKDYVEGHGLGLSLAQRLATEMGGSLRVQSVVGEGATFSLKLASVV